MKLTWKKGAVLLLLLLFAVLPCVAEDEETATTDEEKSGGSGLDFGLDIGLGAETFYEDLDGILDSHGALSDRCRPQPQDRHALARSP